MTNTMLAMGYATPVRLCAASPSITLGDPAANAEAVVRMIKKAEEIGADYLALPELCLAGATLGSLLKSEVILDASRAALTRVCEATRQCSVTVSVGLPYVIGGFPRSCIALIRGSRVIAIFPSSSGENPFGFLPAMDRTAPARQPLTPVSKLAAGFGDELFRAGHEPREGYVMLLSSALNATAKSYHATRDALCAFTARTGMAVAYASPGSGESTTGFVFDGLCAVASQGEILALSEPLEEEPFVYADVQPDRLASFEPYTAAEDEGAYVSRNSLVARDQLRRILELQGAALARRISHIGARLRRGRVGGSTARWRCWPPARPWTGSASRGRTYSACPCRASAPQGARTATPKSSCARSGANSAKFRSCPRAAGISRTSGMTKPSATASMRTRRRASARRYCSPSPTS